MRPGYHDHDLDEDEEIEGEEIADLDDGGERRSQSFLAIQQLDAYARVKTLARWKKTTTTTKMMAAAADRSTGRKGIKPCSKTIRYSASRDTQVSL